jgi:hypothetical protein
MNESSMMEVLTNTQRDKKEKKHKIGRAEESLS